MPRKPPSQPIPLTVHIIARADRDAHPYTDAATRHTFSLRLLADTPLREACTFAAQYMGRELHRFVDAARIEARDRAGFVFGGHEPIGPELGEDGAEVYLVEDAVDADVLRRRALLRAAAEIAPRTPRNAAAKRPRVTPSQRVQQLVQQGAREAMGGEPRKTPLRVAKLGRAVQSEATARVQRRRVSMGSLEFEDRTPSPKLPSQLLQEPGKSDGLIESIEDGAPYSNPFKFFDDSVLTTTSSHSLDPESQRAQKVRSCQQPSGSLEDSQPFATPTSNRMYIPNPQEEIQRAASPADSIQDSSSTTAAAATTTTTTATVTTRERRDLVNRPADEMSTPASETAPQRPLLPPISAALLAPRSSERVIPDSQEPPAPAPAPSQVTEQSDQTNAMTTGWVPNDPPQAAPYRQRSKLPSKKVSPSVAKAHIVKLEEIGLPKQRPDPYDISAVVSDWEDDVFLVDARHATATSKLGSSKNHLDPPPALIPRNSLLLANQSTPKPTARLASAAPAEDQATIPSTPVTRSPARCRPWMAQPATPRAPLFSTPTANAATALCGGRAKARCQPASEYTVIKDSSDDEYEDVLVDMRPPSSAPRPRGSQSIEEAALPWSAPPLRVQSSPVVRRSRGEDPLRVQSSPVRRLRGEDPFWTLRTTGRRTSRGPWSNNHDEANAKNGARDFGELSQANIVAAGNRRLRAQTLPDNAIPFFSLGSPVKKVTAPATSASLKLSLRIPAGKSPLLLVHGSSSSEQGVEEITFVDNRRLVNDQPVSPPKIIETVVIDRSSSEVDGQGELDFKTSAAPVDDEEPEQADRSRGVNNGGDMATLVTGVLPFNDQELAQAIRSQGDEENDGVFQLMSESLLAGDEEAIQSVESHQSVLGYSDRDDLPDQDQADLPDVGNLPPLRRTLSGYESQPQEPLLFTRVPETYPISDMAEMNTPPSGQTTKRKREVSEEFNSEEDRRLQKKARREARHAKKAEKRRLREEKMAQEEEYLQRQQVWQQEERKRLASENAHRRALELEIVVSSPTKAAEMGLGFSDVQTSMEQSDIGSSPPVPFVVSRRLFKESRSGITLLRKEADGRVLWNERSKRHSSGTTSSTQKKCSAVIREAAVNQYAAQVAVTSPFSDTAQSTHMQVPKTAVGEVKAPQTHYDHVFNDWASMDQSAGALAYSPLDIHNRVHLNMIKANLRSKTSPDGQQNMAAVPNIEIGPIQEQAKLVRPELGCGIVGKSDIIASGNDCRLGAAMQASDRGVSGSETNVEPIHHDEFPGSKRAATVKSEFTSFPYASNDCTSQHVLEDDDDDADISRHTIRSPAPSPESPKAAVETVLKESAPALSPKSPEAAPEQASKGRIGIEQQKSDRVKNEKRRKKDTARKQRRKQKNQPANWPRGVYGELRTSVLNLGAQSKRHKQG